MIRLLFISRYRDPTMDRKVELLAQDADLVVCQVKPSRWHDDLLQVEHRCAIATDRQQVFVPMLGRPDDPHRAFYRTSFAMMRSFRPGIIHAEEEPDSLAALQMAVARRLWAPQARLVLHTWQNIDRPRRWVVRLVMSWALRAADAVLCSNSEASAILERHGYRGCIQVIPAIGVDTRVFRPCPVEQKRGGRFVVGCVGRLVYEKGIDTLIEAMRHLDSDTELVIVGAGPDAQTLKAQAADLVGRVRFCPPVPPAQIAVQMCQFDALVLPSRTTVVWKEQFGRVLVEAMACRVPVVGSDSGAIPEVIANAGLIFAEGDAAALAGCLRQLVSSVDLRQDLADRGYRRVGEHYTQERVAAQTADFYKEFVESSEVRS